MLVLKSLSEETKTLSLSFLLPLLGGWNEYAEQTEVLRNDSTHLLTDYTDSSVHYSWTPSETSSTSPSAAPTIRSSIVGVNIQQLSHDHDQVKTSVNNLIISSQLFGFVLCGLFELLLYSVFLGLAPSVLRKSAFSFQSHAFLACLWPYFSPFYFYLFSSASLISSVWKCRLLWGGHKWTPNATHGDRRRKRAAVAALNNYCTFRHKSLSEMIRRSGEMGWAHD